MAAQRTPNPRRMSGGLHKSPAGPSPFKKKVDVPQKASRPHAGMAGTLIKTFAPVIAGVVVISEFAAPYLIMLYYFGVACWQWADKHGGQPIKICGTVHVLLWGCVSGRHHRRRSVQTDRLRADEASPESAF